MLKSLLSVSFDYGRKEKTTKKFDNVTLTIAFLFVILSPFPTPIPGPFVTLPGYRILQLTFRNAAHVLLRCDLQKVVPRVRSILIAGHTLHEPRMPLLHHGNYKCGEHARPLDLEVFVFNEGLPIDEPLDARFRLAAHRTRQFQLATLCERRGPRRLQHPWRFVHFQNYHRLNHPRFFRWKIVLPHTIVLSPV